MSHIADVKQTGIDSEDTAFALTRRSTLKGLAGASLLSLVGVSGAAGTVRASSTNVSLVQSDLSSNITGMGTGPLPATLAYLTGSPTFSGGTYDPYVSQLAGFYGDPGSFTGSSTWIWGSPDGQSAHDEPAGETVRIEETLELTDIGGTFTLEFAADNLIAAYVNGTLVGTTVDWVTPQKVTLTNLVLGSNTIEIRGMNAASDNNVEDNPNPAAVRFELVGPEQPGTISLDIDVKPGSDDNPINPNSRGVIPVVVYSTPDFDATTLDVSTLRFGPGGAEAAHGGHDEDVDGLVDLMLHFPTDDAGFTGSETEAELSGETLDGVPAAGSDSVTMVGGNGRGNGRGR